MKKPLVVIVDDDPAVLTALEAELAWLSDVCRIEGFESAAQVEAAVPGWTAEDRLIAVAVVDQKMPGLSGTELIPRLRAGPPGAHLRAILLTGYSDLDAALTARNDAGVLRYLEKPWQPGVLRRAVAEAFARFLDSTRLDHHYVFREVVDEAGLRMLLSLRYDVYARTPGADHLLPDTAARLDIDAYDAVSRLFGLEARGFGHGALVGALRVCGEDSAPALDELHRVVAPFLELERRLRSARTHPLPLMTYLVDREAVGRLVARIRAIGERVVEPGRLALDPAYRAAAPGAERHLARHIIDGAVAFFFFFFRIEHAILTCVPIQMAFYRPYGFVDAEGTRSQLQPTLGAELACLHGTIASVPEPARVRCEALAARIARTGGACRCASFPECLGGPYETGDFAAVDVFCPLLACERIRDGASPGTGRPLAMA